MFENASNMTGSYSFLGCKNCILTNIPSESDEQYILQSIKHTYKDRKAFKVNENSNILFSNV